MLALAFPVILAAKLPPMHRYILHPPLMRKCKLWVSIEFKLNAATEKAIQNLKI